MRGFFSSRGRLFLGKNNLMKLALGTSSDSELEAGLSDFALRITGEVAVLFVKIDPTSEGDFSSAEKVLEMLKGNELFTRATQMRCGETARQTVKLSRGELPQFPGAIEAHLRSLGMPTSLHEKKVMLLSDFEVCTEGEPVTVDQAQVLQF